MKVVPGYASVIYAIVFDESETEASLIGWFDVFVLSPPITIGGLLRDIVDVISALKQLVYGT
jgi:hypothetical protein